MLRPDAATGRAAVNQRSERNDEPWEPPPGMHKRRCEICDYWYSDRSERGEAACPECRVRRGEKPLTGARVWRKR